MVPDPTPQAGPGLRDTSEDDELDELGERCATAYMQADALQYQAMVLLAEFHHRRGWKHTHCSSTDEWLAWRLGIHRHTAQERLRTALALEHLPLTSKAMERGELSFSKVRSMTRAATPENEDVLLQFARTGSAANLDRFIRGWKLLDRKDEVTAEQLRHERRRLSGFVDTDGMMVIRARLDPEVGAVFMRGVEMANDALYRDEVRERKAVAEAELGKSAVEPTPAQRRADAVGLLAEWALAAGSRGIGSAAAAAGRQAAEAADGDSASADDLLPAGSGHGSDSGASLPAGSRGSRGSEGAPKPALPLSGSRAERYMVMIHVDEATLREDGEPGLSELHDGTRISAETSRRLACDCSVVTIHRGPDGQVRRAGRRRRTVSPQLRRALEARDRGCRFPGCGARFTEAHHVVHWQDGGETTVDNSLLLCRRHHRAVHEGGVTVCLDVNGQAVFFTPKGKALAGAPPRKLQPTKRPGDPASGGPNPSGFEPPKVNAWAAAARYNRDHHIPWAEEARAWEVLDPA
jgi:hypothetical protein